MVIDELTEAYNEEEIDKYLHADLILNFGTNNEQRGHATTSSQGLDGSSIGFVHTKHLFYTHNYDNVITKGYIEKYTANRGVKFIGKLNIRGY